MNYKKNKFLFIPIILFVVFSFFVFNFNKARATTETIGLVRQDCAGYSNCFTSLSAWEAAYGGISFGACAQGDLVCADKIAIAQIDGAWTSPDIASVTIDGWTTDAAHHIKIHTTQAARHKGKWDIGKYVITSSDSNVIINKENYVYIEGLQIQVDGSGASSFRMGIEENNDTAGEVRISNNIIRGVFMNSGHDVDYGIFIKTGYSAGSRNIKMWNNIIYGINSNYGRGIDVYTALGKAYLYNNTIYNNKIGISSTAGNPLIKNNIANGNATDYSGVFDTSSVNNISQDATSPNIAFRNKMVTFIDLINKDFHLSSSDVSAKDTGADLSADANLAFNTDIDNDIRSGVWDIGADEYIGVAPPPPPDTTPPVLSAGSPTGVLSAGTTQTTLSLITSENATCKYGTTPNIAYALITNTLTTTGGTSHSQTITGLTNGTSYNYYVRCSDTSGNANTTDYTISFSIASQQQSDTQAPSIPTNLTATPISSSQINLSWTASTDDVGVAGYKIYRCQGNACAPTVQIATSPTNSYSNTGLTASTAYTYAVSAYDAARNESDASIVVSAQTMSQPGEPDKPLLQPSDLAYLGAFRFPVRNPNSKASHYWGSGGNILAYNPAGDAESNDAFPGSLSSVGHPYDEMVSEISIPEPKISSDYKTLNRAIELQDFVDITGGLATPRGMATGAYMIGGLTFLESQMEQTTPKFYWSVQKYYNVGQDQDHPVYGWSNLNFSNLDSKGIWYGNAVNSEKYSGYIFDVPKSIADTYFGGKYLVSGRDWGWGAGRSYGPSLFAYAPYNYDNGNPPPDKTKLEQIPLLYYTDTDKFSDWTHTNRSAGGAWVNEFGKQGVIIAGKEGTDKNYCYGPGTTDKDLHGLPGPGGTWCYDPCDLSKGPHNYPYRPSIYFYNPEDLLKVSSGQSQPWDPKSYTVMNLNDNIMTPSNCSGISGLSYDRNRGLIYMTQKEIDVDSNYYEPYPIVHVFSINSAPEIDTQSPTVPTSLTATPISSSQINLSWTVSTDNVGVTGYKIYRCAGAGCVPTVQIATSATNSYSNTGLTASTAYTYAVSAYDAAGNESAKSSSVSATTFVPSDTTPPVISNVSASNIAQTSATTIWTTNEPSTHQVEYGFTTAYGFVTPLNSTLMTSHSQALTGLSAGTLYHYRVRSKDAADNEAISTDQTFTTLPALDTTSPSAITNLSSSNITETSAVLSWTSPGDDGNIGTASTYDIRFSTSPITNTNWNTAVPLTGEPNPGAPGITQTYTVAGLASNTTYYFAIKTQDEVPNQSLISNIITFTTLKAEIAPAPAPSSGGGFVSDTTPPATPSSLKVIGITNQIILRWLNPKDLDFVRVKVVRKENSAPVSISDGTIIYEGTGEEFTDTNLKQNLKYYYSVYSFDRNLNYSKPVSSSASLNDFTTQQAEKELAKDIKDKENSNIKSQTSVGKYNLGTVTLKNGSRGEAVKELQRFLNDKLDLGLVIDGALGPKTIAVIKQWQRNNGLVADGLIGPKTKAMMSAGSVAGEIPGCGNRTTGFSVSSGASCAGNISTTQTGSSGGKYKLGAITLQNGSRGEAVKELQRFLNDKLNLGLIIDGKLGPKTIIVVKQWQKDNGLTPDGLVGRKTKAMMVGEE